MPCVCLLFTKGASTDWQRGRMNGTVLARAQTQVCMRSHIHRNHIRARAQVYAQGHTHGNTHTGPHRQKPKRVYTHGEPVCCVCHMCGHEGHFSQPLCRGQACPLGPHVGPSGTVTWPYRHHYPHFAGGQTENEMPLDWSEVTQLANFRVWT